MKGVIIIDSPCPVNHQPLPEPVIQHIVKPIMETRTPAGQKSAAALASQFRTHAELLSQYRAEPTTSEDGLRCVMLRSQDTMGTTTLCGVSYPWLEDQDARSQSIKDWERLVGHPMEVLPIPGNHFEPFTSPHVSFSPDNRSCGEEVSSDILFSTRLTQSPIDSRRRAISSVAPESLRCELSPFCSETLTL